MPRMNIVRLLPEYCWTYALVSITLHHFFEGVLPLSVEKVFILSARFEAFTWAGLLIGMFFKYGLEITDQGVWLFGRLHGAAFLIYFVVSIITAIRLRWKWWQGLLAVLAAIPPLVTLPLELWFRRNGNLSR